MACWAKNFSFRGYGKLSALLSSPTITGTAELVHVANGTLAGAIAEQGKVTSKKYRDTLMQFLPGSAGHALPKVYEKDRATDYQLQDYAIQQKQGVAIQERKNSRIFTWGIGK